MDNRNNRKNESRVKVEELEIFLNKFFEFRNNIILNQIEVRLKEEPFYSELNENSVFRFLHKNGCPVSMQMLRTILGSDFVKEYNPILHYFEKIKDDYDVAEHGDYISQFLSYLNVEDSLLLEKTFKHWMVACIECIKNPTFINKSIFVFFNSNQNSGKSTLARFIVPTHLDPYFVENSIQGKDGLLTLGSCAFHLLDELVELDKMFNSEFKSFISKQKVDVRPPYEKNRISKPRISNFVATSDRQGFLVEDVGTARFIVFEILGIDFDYSLKISADVLWSHALFLHRKKEFIKLEEHTKNQIAENNKNFIKGSVLSELILEIYQPADKNVKDAVFLQLKDIYLHLNSVKGYSIPDRKLGSILGNIGFRKTSHYCTHKKMSIKGYFVLELSTRN